MFDRLFDFVSAFIGYFKFAAVLDPYEGGVVLTLGKVRERKRRWEFWKRKNATIGPGWHFYWPFGIEKVLYMSVAFDTMDLGVQSVTTKDGVSVVLRAYVSYVVFDARRALLETDGGAEQVLNDICSGELEDRVRHARWEELFTDEFRENVKKQIQQQARKWGIGVRTFRFSDLTRSKSLRLFNDAAA